VNAYVAAYGWLIIAVAALALLVFGAVFLTLRALRRIRRQEQQREAERARRRYQATVWPTSERDRSGPLYGGHVPRRPMPPAPPPRSPWGVPSPARLPSRAAAADTEEFPPAIAVAAAAVLLAAASGESRAERAEQPAPPVDPEPIKSAGGGEFGGAGATGTWDTDQPGAGGAQ
jgi:hypothetical protein